LNEERKRGESERKRGRERERGGKEALQMEKVSFCEKLQKKVLAESRNGMQCTRDQPSKTMDFF